MSKEQLKEKYENYNKALEKLKNALERDESDELVLDAVIQRFEFTYELSWKLMKLYLSYSGIAGVRTPRAAFKEAFAAGMIKEGDVWIDMLDDRILTSHTYDESEARNIYSKIKTKYVVAFDDLRESIAGVIEG